MIRALKSAWTHWLQRHWPVLVILALPVIILSPSLFGGRAVTADDILIIYPPQAGDLAYTHHAPQVDLLIDGPTEIDAWTSFTHQELTAGRFPFWNPTVAGGTPFFAAGQPAVLYPLIWVEALLPYPFGLTVVALLKWWIVGLGMYVFARSSLKLSGLAALIPALAFMLGSFWIVWFVHQLNWAVMYLPWLFWLTERIIHQPTVRRVVALALIVGLVGLTGHPEMIFHVLLGGTLYALWLSVPINWQSWRERLRGLACWSGGFVLGLALAAIQYLPLLALLPTSLAASLRGVSSPSKVLPLSNLITWVIPNINGNRAFDTPYWGPVNYNEDVFYAGGVTLALAIIALWALRSSARRGDVAFFAGLALVIGGILYGVPPFSWLTHLPILNTDAWQRLNLLAVFSVCCLAGIGLERVESWQQHILPASESTRRQRWRRWALLWTGVLMAALAGLTVAAIINPNPLKFWIVAWIALALLTLWGAALVLVAYRRGWLAWRKVQYTLLPLVLFDLLLFAVPYIPQPPANLAFPETPTMMRLQQTIGSARMAAATYLIPPESGTPYGLHDLRSYDPTVSARYVNYMLTMDPNITKISYICCQMLTCPSLTLLSVASVDYYITLPTEDANRCTKLAPGQQPTSGPLVPLWTQSGITLWRNTQARPRFYFANQVIASSSASQTLKWLPSLSPNGQDTIIEGAAPQAGTTSPVAGTISTVTDLPGQITLRTQTDTARWLVVNEGYDAGWQADIDGARTTIHPANEMFQAVFVPAGTHTIHLIYRPVGFVPGALLSALALLILLGLALGDLARRRWQIGWLLPWQRQRSPDAAVRVAAPDRQKSLYRARPESAIRTEIDGTRAKK